METILTACPVELIPADQRQLIIRDLLLDLHDKVLRSVIYALVLLTLVFLCVTGLYIYFTSQLSPSFQVLSEDVAVDLMPIVAGAVFTLTAHLSQSVLSEQQQGAGLEGGPSSGFASIANSALHLILRKLLDFILCTGV